MNAYNSGKFTLLKAGSAFALAVVLMTGCQSKQDAAIDTAKLAQIVGTPGEQTGAVYKITIGRDDLTLTEMGAPINARMGLNTWAAFVGTNDNAAVAGDVAMLAYEVQPVLKALRKNGIDVVAIHHHMTGTQPTIYFLHYWATGPAEQLATGFKAALSETSKPKAPAAKMTSRSQAKRSDPPSEATSTPVAWSCCITTRVTCTSVRTWRFSRRATGRR